MPPCYPGRAPSSSSRWGEVGTGLACPDGRDRMMFRHCVTTPGGVAQPGQSSGFISRVSLVQIQSPLLTNSRNSLGLCRFMANKLSRPCRQLTRSYENGPSLLRVGAARTKAGQALRRSPALLLFRHSSSLRRPSLPNDFCPQPVHGLPVFRLDRPTQLVLDGGRLVGVPVAACDLGGEGRAASSRCRPPRSSRCLRAISLPLPSLQGAATLSRSPRPESTSTLTR